MAKAAPRPRQVDAISWALFFIWIGVALLTGIGWAWSLAGVGAIVLGAQAALYLTGDKVEPFLIACGAALFASAIWLMFGLTWSLFPVLLVVFGLWMLGNALLRVRVH